jgi:hypothetical protein
MFNPLNELRSDPQPVRATALLRLVTFRFVKELF